MDDNQQVESQNLDTTTQNNTIDDSKEPKWYRENLAKIQKEAREKEAKIQAELDAIKKAEEDKNKSIEEKLFEIEKEKKELEIKYKQEKTLSKLEKELAKNNLNPEFSNLILKEASDSLSDDVNLEEVVQTLKTNYPSAFLAEKSKPVGQIGVTSVTNDKSITMTREKALEIINSGDNKLYQENLKEISQVL